jgi:hypothetical protein
MGRRHNVSSATDFCTRKVRMSASFPSELEDSLKRFLWILYRLLGTTVQKMAEIRGGG